MYPPLLAKLCAALFRTGPTQRATSKLRCDLSINDSGSCKALFQAYRARSLNACWRRRKTEMRYTMNPWSVLITSSVLTLAAHLSPAQSSPAPLRTDAGYVLGPDDLISIHALDADELNDRPVRIDGDGYIRLPMAGRIKASGLTSEQLEAAVDDHLKTYIKDPQATVSVMEFRSQRVSVLGSVKSPGIHTLEGRRTVVEVLASAGGVTDDAGNIMKITRRIEYGRIPLPSAVDDPTGQYSVAEVNLKEIITAKNPAQNILIAPDDVISIPRAKMVYVIGNVPHPGGYILGEDASLSILKVVSLAGGVDHNAAANRSRILRTVAGNSNRQEIPVKLKSILAGHSGDIQLQPEDILLIPANGVKIAAGRAADIAIQIGAGLAIYRY